MDDQREIHYHSDQNHLTSRDYHPTDKVIVLQEIVRKNDFQGFVVRLVLEGVDMKFEPSRADFETVLLNVFDVFVKAVSMVPRVETKLYPVEVKTYS